MSNVNVNNKYNGYLEVNDEILVNPEIECEYPELIEIFKDLCTKCGKYQYEFDYNGKEIIIYRGFHEPLSQKPLLIDHQWLDYDISQMSNWSKRKIIRNNI